ncbi:MAG TPA: hypothetical protein PKC79_02885 [Solidesulfovibrio magneticus]|nr:hypothetical protein [Solidesulfovibrio magneticus]
MSQKWVTVSSFAAPPQPEASFEAIVAADVARWHEEAQSAGLDPKVHVRLSRQNGEVAVEISPALDAAFTPVQTLWRAE